MGRRRIRRGRNRLFFKFTRLERFAEFPRSSARSPRKSVSVCYTLLILLLLLHRRRCFGRRCDTHVTPGGKRRPERPFRVRARARSRSNADNNGPRRVVTGLCRRCKIIVSATPPNTFYRTRTRRARRISTCAYCALR